MNKYKYIYDIREKLKLYVDDIDVTDDYLSFLIDTTRADFVRNQISGVRTGMSPNLKQEVKVNMEQHTNDEEYFDTSIIRSSEKLPTMINAGFIENKAIVGSGNMKNPSFCFTSAARLPYVGTRNFMKPFVYVAITPDNRVCMTSGDIMFKTIDNIRIWGVFEEPDEANKMRPDYDPLEDPWERDYPVDAHMGQKIIDTILQRLIIKFQIPKDNINDGADSTETATQG